MQVLRALFRHSRESGNPGDASIAVLGSKVLLDFQGNILRGGLSSRAALRLIREWIDLHVSELEEDWELARAGKDTNKIAPLD